MRRGPPAWSRISRPASSMPAKRPVSSPVARRAAIRSPSPRAAASQLARMGAKPCARQRACQRANDSRYGSGDDLGRGRSPLDGERGRRHVVRRVGDVDPDADGGEPRAVGRGLGLDEDAAQLARTAHQVVGPLVGEPAGRQVGRNGLAGRHRGHEGKLAGAIGRGQGTNAESCAHYQRARSSVVPAARAPPSGRRRRRRGSLPPAVGPRGCGAAPRPAWNRGSRTTRLRSGGLPASRRHAVRGRTGRRRRPRRRSGSARDR